MLPFDTLRRAQGDIQDDNEIIVTMFPWAGCDTNLKGFAI